MQKESVSGGIGFGGVLGTMFIAFKLLGIIQWPWWIVLSPLWIPFALVLAVFAAIVGIPLLGLAVTFLFVKLKGK